MSTAYKCMGMLPDNNDFQKSGMVFLAMVNGTEEYWKFMSFKEMVFEVSREDGLREDLNLEFESPPYITFFREIIEEYDEIGWGNFVEKYGLGGMEYLAMDANVNFNPDFVVSLEKDGAPSHYRIYGYNENDVSDTSKVYEDMMRFLAPETLPIISQLQGMFFSKAKGNSLTKFQDIEEIPNLFEGRVSETVTEIEVMGLLREYYGYLSVFSSDEWKKYGRTPEETAYAVEQIQRNIMAIESTLEEFDFTPITAENYYRP